MTARGPTDPRRAWTQWAVVLCIVGTAFVIGGDPPAWARKAPTEAPTAVPAEGRSPTAALVDEGRTLFSQACVSCHGDDGQGTPRGPSLVGAGAAAADFVLTTGRMPLDEPHAEATRKPPAFEPDEIAALTAYVGSLGGPPVPTVDRSLADVSKGGELFRLNCAGCHSAAGSGGVLAAGWSAPDLRRSTDVQVAEALLVGPGRMPSFGQFDDAEVASIVAYVDALQPPSSPGGAGLGFVGPVAEGFVGWLAGLGALVLLIRWIGDRS